VQHIIFEQFFLPCLAHASYMIGDEATGTAAVIDPQRDADLRLSPNTPSRSSTSCSRISRIKSARIPNKQILLSLAQDLPAVWNSPSTDMRLKQRIVHILIQEIVADVDEGSREVILLIHWAGGRHSELRVKKYAIGRHRWCTSIEAIEVIRKMAARFPGQLSRRAGS
jgi:hypothetical protein